MGDTFSIGWVVFIFNVLSILAYSFYLFLILNKLGYIKVKVLSKCNEIVNLFGFISLIASGIILLIAIVVLCVDVGALTVATLIVSVVICVLFTALFFTLGNDSRTKETPVYTYEKVKDEPKKAVKEEVKEEKKEVVKEEPKEEPIVAVQENVQEEPQEEESAQVEYDEGEDEDEDEEIIVSDAKGNIFRIQYNKSFTAKLAQAPDYIKAFYSELKNEMLSYKKTTSRVSWYYESVNTGRKQLFKFSIRGKTLCVYFALNADDYVDSKYLVEKVETKKFETVPCIYRIKNELRMRYAKELIAIVAQENGLVKGAQQNEDYYINYETTEALIQKELIRELKMPATEEDLQKSKKKKIKTVKSVSVAEAETMIDNEVAEESIVDARTGKYSGKKDIINVDVLARNYNDGDTVTLESLKAKKLIDNNIGQVKVLARGVLDKRLNVQLQDYSIEAVKMIVLTGGTVTRV